AAHRGGGAAGDQAEGGGLGGGREGQDDREGAQRDPRPRPQAVDQQRGRRDAGGRPDGADDRVLDDQFAQQAQPSRGEVAGGDRQRPYGEDGGCPRIQAGRHIRHETPAPRRLRGGSGGPPPYGAVVRGVFAWSREAATATFPPRVTPMVHDTDSGRPA